MGPENQVPVLERSGPREQWYTMPPWGARPFEWSVAACIAVGVLFCLLVVGPQAGWFEASPAVDRVNLFFQTIVFLWASLAIASAISRTHGRARWGWSVFTAAMAVMVVGALWYFAVTVQTNTLGPLGTVGLVLYLLCFPAVVVGILLINPSPLRWGSLGRTLLDGAIIALSLFFVQWATFMGPLFEASNGPWTERAADVAFPMFDWFLVTILWTITSRAAGVQRGPLLLLLASVFAFAVSDTGYTYLALTTGYRPGQWVDVGYTTGTLLLGLSALKPAPGWAACNSTQTRPSLWGTLLPFAPVVFGAAAAAFLMVSRGALGPVLDWTGIATVLLVVARQAITLVENHRLARGLEGTANYKTELLRFVSHEMANPITPLKLQLRLLRMADPVRRREMEDRSYQILERNIDRLHRIVNDVLDLSRVDAGRLALDLEHTQLDQVVASAVEAYRPVAHERDLQIHVELTSAPTNIDPQRLGQVLDNLLSNAVKFTPEHGSIGVRAWQDRAGAHVTVEDSGIGMTRTQLEALFKPFGRVHQGASAAPGNGLGLYFSRGIVHAHGGRLTAQSAGPGRGTRFLLSIPNPPGSETAARAEAAAMAQGHVSA